MEGHRMAKRLAVYHEVYRGKIADQTDEDSTTKVPMDTDGEIVEIQLLNDYMGSKVKDEMSDYETTGTIKIVPICNACHGGEMDNPKAVTSAVANILEKWDFCYRKLKPDLLTANVDETGTFFTNLNPCHSIEDLFTYEDPPLNETSFAETVIEGAEKVILHGNVLGKLLLQKGEIKNLCYLLASLCLSKNKVKFYNERLHINGKKHPLNATLREINEVIEAITNQVLEYHNSLICSVVIHDGESQDWRNSKAFYEGERVSINIQFWCYHLKGIRSDLYNILPGNIARRVLGSAFNTSLSILTVRYCQVEPSSRRLNQYRADIVAILLISHEMLLGLVTNMEHLFRPYAKYRIERSIHSKCTILLAALTFVGCPIKTMGRLLEADNGQMQQPHRLQPLEKSLEERLVHWMHLAMPGIYGPSPERLSTPAFIFVQASIAAMQPSPDWSLIVRLCLSKEMEFPILIMKNFGAFVPGMKGEQPARAMRGGCGHFMCHKRCIGTADLFWPQIVGSAILHIVLQGNPDERALFKVLEPLLSRLSHSSWEALDRNVLWNCKRPVWFQSLVDLLEPFFIPAIDDLMADVEAGRTWTLNHVPEGISKLVANLEDLAALIPKSFFFLCNAITNILPNDIRPIGDSVQVHLFISCIYGLVDKMIPVFREWKMQREKVDFLQALNEKLCRQAENESTSHLSRLSSGDTRETTSERRWDDAPEEYISNISDMVTDKIVSQPAGQEAVKSIYRFLAYNSDWIQNVLGISASNDALLIASTTDNAPTYHPKLQPWEDESFRIPTPYEMLSQCSLVPMNQLLNYSIPWEDCLRTVIRECNPAVLLRLLNKRPEHTDTCTTDESDKSMYINLQNFLEQNMLDKSVNLDR